MTHNQIELVACDRNEDGTYDCRAYEDEGSDDAEHIENVDEISVVDTQTTEIGPNGPDIRIGLDDQTCELVEDEEADYRGLYCESERSTRTASLARDRRDPPPDGSVEKHRTVRDGDDVLIID